MKILVSACLLGLPTRYDARSKENKKVLKLLEKHIIIPVCPEQLGGLPTPRPRCEILGGHGWTGNERVVDELGNDRTENFLRGAEITLQIARLLNVDLAILKSKSPSCGKNFVYDGSFSGRLVPGKGVTAFLLEKNGLKVFEENEVFVNNNDLL
ncbi:MULTISPECIES: DUF523 domain-containing protein [Thermotoga]|jgi:uncharacterized protein YbbK (DUF523 family)|uniref:Uncharacterized protein n=2 Tax=Thermotoga TaxID=2335 RepID=B9KBN9_THENN|nr:MULTISPECIES: DUF523 domain-containing protein [Thermotoga]KUK23675.1 MAG: Uncharacterized protein XD57_0210 [Thermotoga petrophila]KUK33503.1 MAG: Uncharacterized protein XD64_0679 [Thermotoga sp. 47_83]HBF10256.1 DUF523 domain-containing protein [Thermotoga neapolitana]ACM22435.1 Putative uncharacterized protein [Thermotoga neapolitana DSM 4359]AJG40394.1 hypothetical protein TRQ7_02795 [Thermotoga sp. RQ7]